MKKRKTLLTSIAVAFALVSAFGFSACGDGNVQTVLTENTDFSALAGEKVTEDGWMAAFAATAKTREAASDSAYDNVTIKLIMNDKKYYWKKSGAGLVSISDDDAPFQFIQDQGDKIADIVLASYAGYDFDGYIGFEYDKTDVPDYIPLICDYRWACPDFSEFFRLFEYDEALKAYTFDHQTVHTNSVFESWDTDWDYATVKIINGRLAFVNTGNYDAENPSMKDDYTIYFYDFGATTITVPAYTPVDPNEV